MKGYGRSHTMQKRYLAARQSMNSAQYAEWPKRARSPRKLEPHEVVAKLKARMTTLNRGRK